ncbi:bacillolysin [Corallococcus coralloides DSM 2259]|uniref:Neutral metalloproteinase n=1 Tax=Corallococcus coralloides (strain ATCC 25202 / DSM 2259 / NBRC 100086 / M2) TaxID=1144275 RepID=H8MS45_CORCM|nr:M4 family metallopeptidase [Corallococcus coralloides]AFE09632.1 bacillolysin [Corallococcus coralloides DSM 2259]
MALRTDLSKPVVATQNRTDTKPVNTVKPQGPVGMSSQSSFSAGAPAKAKATVALNGVGQKLTPGPVDISSPQAQRAVQQTVAYVNQKNPQLTGITGGTSFAPRTVERDQLGMTHVRMDRMHEGVKVSGEQIIGHLDAKGDFDSLTGNVSNIPAGLGKAPTKLNAKDALAIAQKDFNGETSKAPTSEKVIVKGKDGQYHAAYHVTLTDTSLSNGKDPRSMNYFIDANTGESLKQFNTIRACCSGGSAHAAHTGGASAAQTPSKPTTPATTPTTPTTPGTGRVADDQTMYSGKVDLQTTKNKDGTYSLEDKTRGKGIVTYDGKNRPEASGATPITDKNDVWGEKTDPSRAQAGVDAHYGAAMTYDFYKDILGRDSIDGKGEKLISYVHTDVNLVNAFWDGEKMQYGDGDGRDSGPLTTLDIAGHEISHGLTERTAGLEYEGESGGLNESFSDIMGTGVEWYVSQRNEGVKFDWAVGEDAWTPNNGDNTDALRYMNDPTSDGYSIDNYKNYPKMTEVHGSSGIANNAFFLLTEGGKNKTSGIEVKDGIGMEKSLKVFGRALTTYMTPQTNFSEARAATIKAATDLYGKDSTEAKKVAEAWTAVGVTK